jgi:hypothetical protein
MVETRGCTFNCGVKVSFTLLPYLLLGSQSLYPSRRRLGGTWGHSGDIDDERYCQRLCRKSKPGRPVCSTVTAENCLGLETEMWRTTKRVSQGNPFMLQSIQMCLLGIERRTKGRETRVPFGNRLKHLNILTRSAATKALVALIFYYYVQKCI